MWVALFHLVNQVRLGCHAAASPYGQPSASTDQDTIAASFVRVEAALTIVVLQLTVSCRGENSINAACHAGFMLSTRYAAISPVSLGTRSVTSMILPLTVQAKARLITKITAALDTSCIISLVYCRSLRNSGEHKQLSLLESCLGLRTAPGARRVFEPVGVDLLGSAGPIQ